MQSLRTIRGRFVRGFALLTIGATIVMLNAKWRDDAIAPGPLARQHAQLLERTGADPNCGACHAAAERNIAGWMASLVISHENQPRQSQLCMQCHSKTITPESALMAHNVPPNLLRQLTENRTLAPSHPTADTRSIGCAACHREHHGVQADLTAVDNVACQTCHQQRYESFAGDHPDFGIWPYERRTRIVFNHASHRDKHFVEKKTPFDCKSCHVQDATGGVQLLANYETSCAKCHNEKIATSVARGVPMIALPTMDVAALRTAGFDVGPWPKAATGDFDGRLPPPMKLLLAADPAAAQAIGKLGADFDFQDVNPKDGQQLKACAEIASAIKKLMTELSGSSTSTVRDRLQVALGRKIPEADVAALVAGLSADTLRSAADAWSIGTSPTKSASQAQAPSTGLQTTGVATNIQGRTAFAPAGTWFRDDGTFSIRYRPSAHADPVLASWLNVLAETPHVNRQPIAGAMFKELSKPTAPGLCASCHSIEQPTTGALVNWRAYDRRKEPRGFTKFSHGPHLLLRQLADCSHCHAIDAAAGSATPYADVNPAHFVSDFSPHFQAPVRGMPHREGGG